MGSSMPDGEGFDDLPDADSFADPEAGSTEKPFDEEPFDAGVEADEDESPEKYIQQLSGKLGQSLRKYTEEAGAPDFDLEKFAINSVLSATNSGEMDQQDQSDIIAKVKSSTTSGTGAKNNDDGASDGADDGAMDDEGGNEEGNEGGDVDGIDLDAIDMEETYTNTVFKEPTLGVKDGGMEENKYIKESIKKMIKASLITEEPQVKPQTLPKVNPSRRAQPYRIIPEQLPDPSPKAEEGKTEIKFLDSSDFTDDGNGISLTFDVDGTRFNGINFLNTGEVVQGPMDNDEPYVYAFQSDVLDNGKQYIVNVSKFGNPENPDKPVFTDGDAPEIEEV